MLEDLSKMSSFQIVSALIGCAVIFTATFCAVFSLTVWSLNALFP